MSPAWALEGGGATPQPLRPPRTGLVAWYKGDSGITSAGGLVSAWADSSGHAQDLDSSNAGFEPSSGLDDIDGIPCVSFPTLDTSATYLYRSTDMLDRLGNPITSGPRTVVVIARPVYSGAAFGITGGPAFTFFQNTVPQWGALFDLEDTAVPGSAYVWSAAWRDLANASQVVGGLVGGGAGPFNGTPTLLQWQSTGYANLTVRINNAPIVLNHQQYGGPPGPALGANGFMLGNTALVGAGLNFLGNIPETLVYDWSLDDAAQTKLIAYVASRYPSVPLA